MDESFAWLLTIDLTDKPFGDKYVYVTIKGPYGWEKSKSYLWKNINDSPTTATVAWNLPNNEFPKNGKLKVCVSSNALLSFVLPNCKMFTHKSGDGYITMSLR